VPGGTGATGTAQGGLVNLNTSTAEELEALPGVGPSTAAAIIAHRDANGPFTSVEQLIDVRGIGDAKLEQLRHLVTV
jgi:competence protein ComEA